MQQNGRKTRNKRKGQNAKNIDSILALWPLHHLRQLHLLRLLRTFLRHLHQLRPQSKPRPCVACVALGENIGLSRASLLCSKESLLTPKKDDTVSQKTSPTFLTVT